MPVILSALLIAAAAVILIRSKFERKMLEETCFRVPVKNIPEELSGTVILFLSDLHGEYFGEGNVRLIRMIENAHPDVLLLGGDMITVKENVKTDTGALEAVLRSFSGKIPVYYGLGNHETRAREKAERFPGAYDALTEILNRYRVKVLDNDSAELVRNGAALRITGLTLPDRCYRKFISAPFSRSEIEQAVGRPAASCEVVLAHSPLYGKDLAAWGADLVLSGHFHGGTIRLPLLGGLMTPQFQFFSPYARGKKCFGDTTELVSGGLGTHSIRIRFLNRPEVLKIILERKEST